MLCLSPLTLLIFGQLQRAVDVRGHLPGGEVTLLLAPAVGVVGLGLQTALKKTHEG